MFSENGQKLVRIKQHSSYIYKQASHCSLTILKGASYSLIFTMASMMIFFYSIVAFLFSTRNFDVSAASCCLRTSPMHRLRDGLDLQNNLIRNKHKVNIFFFIILKLTLKYRFVGFYVSS